MRSVLSRLLVSLVVAFCFSGTVVAATLSLSEAVMRFEVTGLVAGIETDATAPLAPVMVSSGAGSFALPGSIFQLTSALPTQLFTGLELIDTVNVTIVNQPLNVSGGGGPNGGFGGIGGVTGNLLIDVLGGFQPLIIPLSPVGAGAGGAIQAGGAALMVTVTGHAWTTGAVTVTGLSLPTPGGGTTSRFTVSGFDTRTAGHVGSLLLVTPFRIVTNAAGSLGGVTSYSLTFVPEPSALVLWGTAAVALLALGRLRRNG